MPVVGLVLDAHWNGMEALTPIEAERRVGADSDGKARMGQGHTWEEDER